MNRKNGVSMIVLSITILVMAILAATAIISLEDSGIIGRSKSTVTKQNYMQEYERLQSVKNGMLANNFGEITVADYIEELRSKGILETGEQTNPDDSTTVVTKTGMVANLLQDGESNIIISLGTPNATIALSSTSVSGDVTSGSVTREVSVSTENVIGDISWTTSNATVATVSGNNTKATVTLKNPGVADITATYGSAKESFRVTVTGAVATPIITFNKTTISKTIDAGTTATETITATTSNITGSLVWTSSNTNVATVSASGNVATITIKAGGTTIITAKSGSATATCTVVVTENEPTIYELSGKWEFNAEILRGTTVPEMTQIINFTSNGNSYAKMMAVNNTWTLPSGNSGNEGYLTYITSTNTSTMAFNSSQLNNVGEDPYWAATAYRTVDFGSTPQSVSEEFYNWFIANAIKQESNNVERRIWLTDGSYLMTADANSTWSEIVGSGLTIYDTYGEEWLFTIENGYLKATWQGTGIQSPAGFVSGMMVEGSMLFGAYSSYSYSNDGYIYVPMGTNPA